MSNSLDTELKTYEAHKAELLGRSAGKFVLIKGDKIIGTFESQADAVSEGYKQFGIVPFLVKQILEFDSPLHFVSGKIAI